MGYNFRQIVIVGRNPRAENIAKKIKEKPGCGVYLLGYLDCTENGNSSSGSSDLNLIGKLEDLETILREKVVDEVIVTLPLKSFYSEIEKIISICENVGVEVKIPTDLFNRKLAKSTVSNYHDFHVIDFYTSPKMTWKMMVKRLMDIIISVLLLVILAPIMLVVAILIKVTSKGPVHFTQQRIGYNGRLFTCLKFRTMVENAEERKKDLTELNEMEGPVFKIKNDPRVTKIGRFLRKTSIDEFPQLINVVKGDMSLVGPRPPLPCEVCEYGLCDRRRLSIRPGITCLWQVNGRNTISFDKWMELDRQYIDNWSLWLDIKILAKTIPAVLKGSGAA
jgi:exopolysaccharide biosynthesis polyprenyl glycosylphosphotransferase